MDYSESNRKGAPKGEHDLHTAVDRTGKSREAGLSWP